MQSPLPVRNGVNATRLRIPREGPWASVMDYMLERFGHVDPEGIIRRFQNGEVVGLGAEPLTPTTPLGVHDFLWYYRNLPDEPRLPVTETILFQDENLLVVDKPHFLPTTPGGRFVQESALVRLRNRLGRPDLIPMHRLDRATAGVILFSTNPATRGAYQILFEHRRIEKEYRCVSALPTGWGETVPGSGHDAGAPDGASGTSLGASGTSRPGRHGEDVRHVTGDHRATAADFPLEYRNRMAKEKGHLLALTQPGEPNAETRIDLLRTGVSGGTHAGTAVGLFRLRPHSGKTHQLRVHMAALGLGIVNDPFYPVLLDQAPDDYARPLQLLAHSISFTDPLSGQPVSFTSERNLCEFPGRPA
ncbi:pseudouridine synthase [Arthrobacter sp. JSM 101049]|uniref:pseudouridine synthase n=1 Tax=Arthrobacter sp. JSM 101049 TaxID=929097 RepID=UPI00356284D9